MQKSKLFSFAVAATLFVAVTLTSCGGGLPNGRYEPVDEMMRASWVQAIIINGDNFTVVFPLVGTGLTVKYKYTNGTLSFLSDDGVMVGQPCEYKDDLLYYGGVPFKKTN